MTIIRLSHVGLTAPDPAKLAGFYTSFLGLRQTASFETPQAGEIIMLSGRPKEAFQELSIAANPQARHVAFQIDALAGLRELYARALNQQVKVIMSLDHGSQLSFYFLDPEGNVIEALWPTGRWRDVNQPVDLTQSEAELRQLIEA